MKQARIVATTLALFLTMAAKAKSGIGLQVGSAPTYGVYFAIASNEENGFYFDIQGSRNAVKKSDIYSFSRTYAETVLNDQYLGDTSNYTVVSGGATLPFSKIHSNLENNWAILSLSIVGETTYRRYYDQTGILGSSNNYYIKDSDNTTMGLGIGIIHMFESWNIKLSFESFKAQTSIGIGGNF